MLNLQLIATPQIYINTITLLHSSLRERKISGTVFNFVGKILNWSKILLINFNKSK